MIETEIRPMLQAHQIAWMQHHEKDDSPPTFEDALTRFDDWLNDAALNNMSTEEAEYRMALGLSLNG
jgi:hypothetical protein